MILHATNSRVMADLPQDTDEEEFLCLDEFPDNTTVMVPKPTVKKLYVFSEFECLIERVELEDWVVYRNMRLRKAGTA